MIRTIFLKGKKAYIGVGSGITVDSSPEKEYIETLYKAKPLFSALGAEEMLNESLGL
jgi:para-aminobenzoate synthetase component 1